LRTAFEGIGVIEYGGFICAPYCSKMLADLGADVVKIEPPGGDIARRRGPYLDDIPGPERSGFFLYLNTNKRGVTLDIEKATGKEIFKKLIKDADILIEDTAPGKLDALGLGYADLESINPRLVMTSITPFGQTGPYRGYKGSDLIAWQMGGEGYLTPRHVGNPDQEPLRAMQMGSFIIGTTAALGTLNALQVQQRDGVGQQVDVSHLESIIPLTGECAPYWAYEHRSASRIYRAEFAPEHFVRCKDGWIVLHGMEEHHWRGFVEMMGNPGWAEAEVFKDTWSRGTYWDSLLPLIEEWTTQYTKAEVFEMTKTRSIPVGPARSMSEVMDTEQFKVRDFFAEIEHPETGRITYPGAPFKFSRTPWAIRSPAPLLGQHNLEVYCQQLGYSREELVKMFETGII